MHKVPSTYPFSRALSLIFVTNVLVLVHFVLISAILLIPTIHFNILNSIHSRIRAESCIVLYMFYCLVSLVLTMDRMYVVPSRLK